MKKGSTIHRAIVVLAFCMTLFVPLREVWACTIGHGMAVGDYGDNACHELPASLVGNCLTSERDQCFQHCAVTSPFEVAIKGQKSPLIKAAGFFPEPIATLPSLVTLSKLHLASLDRASAAGSGSSFGASTLLKTHRLRL